MRQVKEMVIEDVFEGQNESETGDQMKKSQFTEEQIAHVLRQAESGTPVAELIRKKGISEQTFYRWKKKFAG